MDGAEPTSKLARRLWVLIAWCSAISCSPLLETKGNPTPATFSRFLGPDLHTLLNAQGLAKIGNPALELIRQLLNELQECKSGKIPSMRKVLLTNKTVTCNDGSPAGYYIRESHGSKRWIVYLEGGWYCLDRRSCENRWLRMRNLMSSTLWPESKNVGGILSADPEENPYWWGANQVFVPYCSSDTWSGAAPAKEKGDFAFLGSLIVLEVIKDLLTKGLGTSEMVLLAGSSAGGIGVIINLDRVTDMLREQGSEVEVRGLADSGWFLDNEPYQPLDCSDPQMCAPVEAVKQGIRLWNGQVPDRCKMQYSSSDLWKCYFGYRVYPTLQTPLFVFQWLFDEAQMTVDNVGAPVSKAQWDYIHKMGDDLRASLQNVSAVFAPSCISHSVLTKRDWRYVKISKISLPQALRCWELQDHEHNHHHHHPHHHLFDPLLSTTNTTSATGIMLADMPITEVAHHPTRERENTQAQVDHNEKRTPDEDTRRTEKRKQRKKDRKRRRQNKNRKRRKNGRKALPPSSHRSRDKRSLFPEDLRLRHQWTLHEDLCNHWLMDECSWPQCNRACPRLHNPFTGEEMDFIELLKSFGLDMSSVANALGIDLATLNDMDHDTLLQLLTQQTNK